ncbi:DNA translocase FtsK [Peptoniphilus sp.]|uniref:DNA translocase FtsK n=1 Tax=Peptoniphilus sp. TaxID=1971214 RepID=UPI003D92100D
MGLVGNVIYKLFSIIAGSANFMIPVLIIFWGILYNLPPTKFNMKRYIISSSVILLCILIILDGSKELDMTLIDRINKSAEYLDITRSGGVFGAIFGFFSYKLFGSVGTYIVVTCIILFSIYMMLKPNVDQILILFEDVGEYIESKKDKIKERKDRKEEKSKEVTKIDKEVDEDLFINSAGSTDNVVVKDYKNENLESSDSDEESKIEKISKSENSKDKSKDELEDDLDFEDTIKSDIENHEEATEYTFPDIALLNHNDVKKSFSKDVILNNGKIIESTMANFGIDSKIVAINRGPVITSYELKPAPGVKLSKIVSLSDNISMALSSSDLRIEAPIPGKNVVGIEVPNKSKDTVGLREIIESREFKDLDSKLPLALGKDVEGNIIVSSLEDMPHLLIAGATGSGKSVCINSIITSIIYKSSPADVKLMLIDPKIVELSVYNGIPHLLIDVVTNPKKAAFALNWAVDEMEKRYEAFAKYSVRDLKGFNEKMIKLEKPEEKMPQILIIVDELADLMMVASKEIEEYIARLAQKARAAGMHLILATQRPSVDVITGTIKANIPSRIAFSVSSSIDSRTILDIGGAEKLLGKGDMLFYPVKYPKPKRIQGTMITDDEVERVVNFVKMNNSINNKIESKIEKAIEDKKTNMSSETDELFKDAVNLVLEDEQASISYLQRKLRIGYSRAGRIVDQMEEVGIIGPHEGSKPRKLLMTREEVQKLLEEKDE